MVNSNLPRSNFPFIWEGQSWSTQICLDLIFPLFGRVSMLVNSNLARSNFPFISGGVKVGSNLPDLIFPLFGGDVKVGQFKSA